MASAAIAPRLTAALFLASMLCVSWAGAHAATGQVPAIAPQNFGTPPSGEIPILFNDHTVYTKPDILKQSRVLAALVRNGQIYIPLRSMFEQMGATVTASADGNTVTATKPGGTVSVTVDKPEV